MENSFNLKIVTPEKDFYSGNVVSLNCETTDGRRGVLANHCAMVAALIPTIITFEDNEGRRYKAKTSQGIMKVKKNHVIMLCNYASWDEASTIK